MAWARKSCEWNYYSHTRFSSPKLEIMWMSNHGHLWPICCTRGKKYALWVASSQLMIWQAPALPRRQSPSQDAWFGSSTWDGFISHVLLLGVVVQWTTCATIPGNPAQQKRIKYKHQSNFIGWNITLGLPRWLSGEEFSCQCRKFRFNPWVMKIHLEKEMANYSSILAWNIPWTEEPGKLQSMGSQKGWTRLSD